MATTTTAVSFDEDLLARITARARELGLSLNRLLAVAAEEYLARRRSTSATSGAETSALLKDIDAAWSDGLDQEDRTALAGMRKKYRRAVKDTW